MGGGSLVGQWDSEKMTGLAPDKDVTVSHLRSLLWDETASTRKYSRTLSIAVDSDMYEAIQNIIAHKNMPFNGSISVFGRHAIAVALDNLKEWLDADQRTIFDTLLRQQRRLTRERFVVEADELVEEQAEFLRFWTDRRKWASVVKDLHAFADEVRQYDMVEWKQHVANRWLQHPQIKGLLKRWENEMAEDDPAAWRKVRDVFAWWEGVAGV